jgi:hypothetical protein
LFCSTVGLLAFVPSHSDIGDYTKGFDLCQFKAVVIEELVYRVRHARVAVTDAVDEAPADASPWEPRNRRPLAINGEGSQPGAFLASSIAATAWQSSSRVRSHLNPQVVYASSMAQSAKKILKQALLLPDKERAEVIAELLESLPPSDPAESRSDEEWIAEVERRARAALAGSASLSWEQARMQIRERLERK